MIKTCARCKLELPIERFRWKNEAKGWRQPYCIECNKAANKEHYRKNKDLYLLKARAWEESKGGRACLRYNIPPDELVKMKNRFDGKCWSCKERPGTHVDHDHSCCPGNGSCGECVRGILCRECNLAIGYMQDNVDYLTRAVEYLELTTRSCSDG